MTLLDQLKRSVDEEEFAGKHPLLKIGVRRDVRDAYFEGIVLAALVDDNKIDGEERGYIKKMGVGLGLPMPEIEEVISRIESGGGTVDLVKEIAKKLSDPKVAKLFLAEFSLIWTSHTVNLDALQEWRDVLVRMIPLELPQGWFGLLDAAISSDMPQRKKAIAQLSDFDSDTIAYLFGDSGTTVAKTRCEEKKLKSNNDEEDQCKASIRELERKLVQLIEESPSVSTKDVLKLASRTGLHEHQVTTILQMLLPHARKSFKAFIAEAPKLRFSRDSTESKVEIGWACFYSYSWSWRSKNGETAARRAVEELFERILSEFEFRARF